MSSRSSALIPRAAKRPRAAASKLKEVFGDPPLLESEDPAQYQGLAQQIEEAVKPRDAIEGIGARDLTDLTWEILRLRKWRAHLMRSSAHKGLKAVLDPLVHFSEIRELTENWAKRDPEAVAKVNGLLKDAGIEEDAIAAQTLRAELSTIEVIENLIARAETRRHVILREFDRRRHVIARRVQDISEEIQDAEYKELNNPDSRNER